MVHKGKLMDGRVASFVAQDSKNAANSAGRGMWSWKRCSAVSLLRALALIHFRIKSVLLISVRGTSAAADTMTAVDTQEDAQP